MFIALAVSEFGKFSAYSRTSERNGYIFIPAHEYSRNLCNCYVRPITVIKTATGQWIM